MSIQPDPRQLHPEVHFGDRLRRLRLDAGLDQRPFGDLLGISHATVSNWESRRSVNRGASQLAAAAELAFGIPGLRHWLLTGEWPPAAESLANRGYTAIRRRHLAVAA